MYESQVAKLYGVGLDAIVGVREVDEGAYVRALIDYGIAGIKVYEIPKSDLASATVSLPAAYDLNAEELSYKQLQAVAKDRGIPANQSAAAIRAALEEEE